MRTVYIDSSFMCHTDNADGRIEIQTDMLDGFGDVAIESIRYIPAGETYTAPNGTVFHGLFIQVGNNVDKEQKQYSIDMEILNIITEGEINETQNDEIGSNNVQTEN